MIKHLQNSFKNYIHELNALDLVDFNKFIVQKLLLRSMNIHTILPLLAVIGVIAFSISLQDAFYVFIPQSSITAFASYVVFACVTALAVLFLYPLLMIVLLNYLAHKLRLVFKRLLLPVKILILIVVFHIFIKIVSNTTVSESLRIYMTGVWFLFYFVMANFYLVYKEHMSIRKLSRFKVAAVVLFIILFVKPFLLMFLYTSEVINYTAINPNIYLSHQNCTLISTPIDKEVPNSNMTINDTRFFESSAENCLIKGNAIRYGFSSDYVIIFKKNVEPIKNKSNQDYNAYVRLICYYGNCYSDDNVVAKANNDSIAGLINTNMARRQQRMLRIEGR